MSLQTLLSEELALTIEYDRDHGAVAEDREPGDSALASHVPMALHALQALGASEAQLSAAFEHHRARMPQALPWPALDTRQRQFAAEADVHGIPGLLERRLPVLMRHAGSVAFHALIRTAHAFESGHRDQLLRALAWWAVRKLPVPMVSDRPPLPLPAWWEAILGLPTPRPVPTGLISHRMRAWSLQPAFAAWAPALQLDADTPRQLARAVARAYAASGNFTLLHGVTGTRAFQVLAGLLPAPARGEALRAFSVHLAAALRASNWNGQVGALPAALPWSELQAAALAPGQDEHVIKLIHAARWFDERDPDPLWRQVASRAVTAPR